MDINDPHVFGGMKATVPTPRCLPGGETDGTYVPVTITVEGFKDPAEVLFAIMDFGRSLAEGIEQGAVPSNLKREAGDTGPHPDFIRDAPQSASVRDGNVRFIDATGEGGGLCDEHAAEVAAQHGADIAQGAEEFLRQLSSGD